MSETSDFQLTPPESVTADPEAIEILRMWWSKGEPVMSIKPAFNDPLQFGQLPFYAAKHMAHGYAVRHGHDERQAYQRILQGLSDVIKADNVQTVAEPVAKPGSVQ